MLLTCLIYQTLFTGNNMIYKKLLLTFGISASFLSCSAIRPEKKITVIIPSFNNESAYHANLSSVINQEYDNYNVIYINDASTDNTGPLVQQFIADNNLENRITYIQNSYNRKALANMYRALLDCDPLAIIVELDGDDSFASTHLLKDVNELFSSQDVWFAYAQYKNVPEEKAKENKISVLGYTKPTPAALIESRDFRTKWFWSGLRMYYAWLVKEVKLEDLLLPQAPYNGKFFPTSKDGAFAYPMLEMAGHRIKHIPDVWLLRNIDTPLNDYKIARDLQLHCGKMLKESPRYARLEKPVELIQTDCKADLVILADSLSAEQIKACLETYTHTMPELHDIWIMHSQKNMISPLCAASPNIHCIYIAQGDTFTKSFTSTINGMNDIIIITDGKQLLTEKRDLTACITLLKSTQAYAFYLGQSLASFGDGNNILSLPCEQIKDNMYAWKFNSFMPCEFAANNTDLTLYRKADIAHALESVRATDFNELVSSWQNSEVSPRKIGLFIE